MSEIQPMQSFQDNLKERLTKDIGELLPDNVLSEMIEAQISELFFKPHVKKTMQGYHTKEEVCRPIIHEILRELLEGKVRELVSTWVIENQDQIWEMMQKQIGEEAVGAGLAALQGIVSTQLDGLQNQVYNNTSGIVDIKSNSAMY